MDTTDQQEKVLGASDASAEEVADTIDQSFGFLSEIDVTLPLSQLILFAVFASLCLILGKHKVGLLAAYGFLFYWVFVLNQGSYLSYLISSSILPISL